MTAKTLFVGIGSPHGDDQVGWHVADALVERLQASPIALSGGATTGSNSPVRQQSQLVVRKARNPADVFDWIKGIDRLVICDACRSGGPPGSTYRWTWPDPAIEHAHCSGSHDLGLATVLDLAQRLHSLPQVVIVWGIEADNLENDLSITVVTRLAEIENTIWSDLGHA